MTFRIIPKIKALKISSNVKNGAIFSLFSFFNQGINFLVMMLLVTLLTQEDFGHINLFTALVAVIATLIPLGTTAYIGTNFFVKNKNEMQDIYTGIYIISFAVLLILLFILFTCRSTLVSLIHISFTNQILAVAICYFQIFTTINLEMWRLQEEPTKYGIYTSGVIVLNVIITLFFILKCDLGWIGRVYAMFVTNLIFFVLSLYILRKHEWLVFKRVDSLQLKKMLLFGLPLVPHTITVWMRQGIDRYIINYNWDLTSVAVFSFAINLSSIIQMIGFAFNASNSVFIYKMLAKEEKDTYLKLLKQIKLMTIFFAIITILIWIVSKIGISFFLVKYTDSIELLLPLCVSAFFQCIYLLYVNFLFYYGYTKKIMYTTVSVSIVHVALSVLLCKYSIMYTAYINLFSNFAICILIIFATKQIIHARIKNTI